MTEYKPSDAEIDEELERWADPWALLEREHETVGRWMCIVVAIVFATAIGVGLAYCYLVNGNG